LFAITSLSAQNYANWGYWLTDIDPLIVQESEYELIVIDYSRTGADPFSQKDLTTMKAQPNGKKRTVISYFSIGEAEEYRYYWNANWKNNPPSWIEKENPDWPGNYKVKYWDPTWQSILFGNKDAYLDKIIHAGFDGIYLDIIDAFEYFESERPSAENEMVELIKSISEYAKLINPDFLVITQNGERLLAHNDLLQAIDGAAKEDLYYGLEGDDVKVIQSEIDFSIQYLLDAQKNGKFILLASYVPDEMGKEFVKMKSTDHGFVPYFGNRELDRLFKKNGLGAEPYKMKSSPISASTLRTPGDFFLNTLYKGQFKSSIAGLIYDENSVYSEQDDLGNILFSENVSYREQLFPLTIEYGLSDHFEVGIRLPITHTSLRLEETVGGNLESESTGTGIGNIALIANLSIPFKEELNLFSLLSMEFGLPTDTKSEELKSGSFFVANYTIEKIWDHLGLALGTGVSNYNLSESLGETDFTYKAGVLGIFTDRIFGDIFYTRRGSRSFIEASAEILISRNSSLEFYFSTDMEDQIDVKNLGITFTIFH